MARSIFPLLKIYMLGAFIVLSLFSCTRDDITGETVRKLYFVSLTADSDSLHYGQSTVITAEVDGTGITYKWHASSGEILGTGYRVTFIAKCTCPYNEVSCTASDNKVSITRSITITIY
jgi:hypothetical protein